MSIEAWRPHRPQRMAAVGIFGTVVMTPVFLIDVERGGGDLTAPAVIIAVAALIALAVLALARGLHHREIDDEVTLHWYAWSIGAIGVVTAIVANAGADPRRYGIVYGTIIATQAAVYPARGQALLITLAGLSYTYVMAPVVPVTDIVLQLAMFGVMGVLVAAVSSDLNKAHRAEERARRAAEDRTSLAAAISRLSAVELDDVSNAIVNGLVDLGFDIVHLALAEPDGLSLVRSRGAGSELPSPASVEQSIAGLSLAEGRTVTTPDHGIVTGDGSVGGAMATPILADDRVVGVLFAGRRSVGDLDGPLVETVELLAAQAGRALSIARLIERERETVRRLTELDAMKSDFVSNVSHELRTPLTVIRGLGETLHSRWDVVREAEFGQDLLGRINANAQRLESVITGLLDFSRFQAGATEVVPRPTALTEIGGRVLDRMEPLFEGRELEADLDDVDVVVDPDLIEHVLENLLNNALKHTPKGTPVSITSQVDVDEVWVAVVDDGPGVPAGDVERLTERFYQGDGETGSGGIGLGLALCQEILKAHGSELEITSEVGRGAQFAFRMRLAAPLTPGTPRHGADAVPR